MHLYNNSLSDCFHKQQLSNYHMKLQCPILCYIKNHKHTTEIKSITYIVVFYTTTEKSTTDDKEWQTTALRINP